VFVSRRAATFALVASAAKAAFAARRGCRIAKQTNARRAAMASHTHFFRREKAARRAKAAL